MWQPFVWLLGSAMYQYQFYYFLVDPLIAVLAIYGLRPLWHKQRVFVLWLIMGLIFLLLWPTKWPQYILILTFPLCLAAAEGFKVTIWRFYQVYGNPRAIVTMCQVFFWQLVNYATSSNGRAAPSPSRFRPRHAMAIAWYDSAVTHCHFPLDGRNSVILPRHC